MAFKEADLEKAIKDLLVQEGYSYVPGEQVPRKSDDDVIIESDLRVYLHSRYDSEGITESEISRLVLMLRSLPSGDLYESNKRFCEMLGNGYMLKRDDANAKDLLIDLVDFRPVEGGAATNALLTEDVSDSLSKAADVHVDYHADCNIIKFVNQFDIVGSEKRIPDAILFVNGLPLVVFEFKSAVREEATVFNAYEQLTVRYRRDIPQLFVYNAFCVISDGVNNRAGSFFASYDYYYAWRRVEFGDRRIEAEGIESLYSMIQGMFNRKRLLDIFKNFQYFPDSSKKEQKVLCRYPQYYAARALFQNISKVRRPGGDGKGGTYFGATGCGKSFTMLFLTRLLMRSKKFGSPTIVLITDRTDLDDQLSGLFLASKKFIGDEMVQSVESRADLRAKLQGRKSGGVFLTTIQKFSEDIELLTDRNNVVCISDEAHRTQTNLDQKVVVTEKGVRTSYGFARYLHDSLPNATYVGFTGTPIDATLDVFGKEVDIYTMTESVNDGITVPIVYEGRAAKVVLNNSVLAEIEKYYDEAAEQGSSEYQIEQSKKDVAKMESILGDPDRLKAVAADFVAHYDARVQEKSTVRGKAMFVCYNRQIAYALYKNILELRPEWGIAKVADEQDLQEELTDKEKRELKPVERIKMVMTRSKDDDKVLYDLLGTKEDRKELDRLFKQEKSNFKIAIVVDMWLTGFDVPCLDAIYIDKPIQQHSLIQTISRVNRTFEGKDKGIVVDYIGIKKKMNMALKQYGAGSEQNVEDISMALKEFRDHLDLLDRLMYGFDDSGYFKPTGDKPELCKLECLKNAQEYVQKTKENEARFMGLTRRLKAAYDICVGNENLTQKERDRAHFYFAIRSIIFKLTKGDAPDVAQMNAAVREMIAAALESEGVEDVTSLNSDEAESAKQNIFDESYLEHINRIKLPNTKIKLLQRLLQKAIAQIRKVNKVKGIDFTAQMQRLVENYNNRTEQDVLKGEVYEEIAESLTEMIMKVRAAFKDGEDRGLSFEETAFYDILKNLCIKYHFTYPEDKLIALSKEVKKIVDNQAAFPDWDKRDDIKSALKVDLIIVLDEFGYPPVERDEVYVEIFEQAENFKKNR
ncbi:MAG: type I restriction endonuclease subunit R [Lachnospiraceae bacterium]|nr:type I restriction endonuclease subunit R [Lachnospiraceae bacterium]